MNIWYFHPYAGGPGIGKFDRPYQLARHWCALGHDATVFVARFHHLLDKPEPLPPETVVDGVRYVALDARPYAGNGLSRIFNMADYCRAAWVLPRRVPADLPRPDAIIVSSPHPFPIYSARHLARRFDAKLVFEVRDLWPLSITEINGTPAWHPFVLLAGHAERFAYRNADLVASLLGGAEEHMRAKGLKPGKFVHVPNGTAVDRDFSPIKPSTQNGIQAEQQIDKWHQEGRIVVIHAGAQGVPNGLHNLIKAIRELKIRKDADRIGVLLLGNGGLTDTLKRTAAELGLDNIVFIPPVPKKEALWIIGRCDIGFAGGNNYERVYRYGLSFNKIFDYMMVGVPIILPLASRSDPVSASGAGIVTGDDSPVAIADAIARLVAMSPEQRVALGQRGRDYVRSTYAYDVIAGNYAQAIASH